MAMVATILLPLIIYFFYETIKSSNGLVLPECSGGASEMCILYLENEGPDSLQRLVESHMQDEGEREGQSKGQCEEQHEGQHEEQGEGHS